ncbi:MAG: HD domain-containing protein [Chloroflexota bacterium]|nr:HD domain-containing protein [Chloroflexota bacterium]MDE2941891.1 HD domain-containing protein [Chloroflexota bacterium]MDE3268362.1 HD domain-containing protein [Chloroflexota bacterium]
MIPRSDGAAHRIELPNPAVAPLRQLRANLADSGAEAYVVGGFLRDLILGIPATDIDLAVRGDAIAIARDAAKALGASFVLLHEEHAIARIVLPRSEPDDGPRWTLDLTSYSGGIEQDLAGRDFAINAMAASLDDVLACGDAAAAPSDAASELRLLDLCGGLDDIRARRIRVVSVDAFRSDAARLLRAVRLAARLGFTIDEPTRLQIGRDAHLLTGVAAERLRDEFLKTLGEPDATASLRLMDELGLLCRLIPELEESRDVEQPREHYWDVFYHCLETPSHVERLTEGRGEAEDSIIAISPWRPQLEAHFDEEVSDGHTRRTIVKLAGLLHDVAKPATKTVDDTGRMRFFGHDARGADMCQSILRRLRISSRGVDLVDTMVRHHLRPTQMRQGVELPTPRAIYRFFRDLGEAAVDTLYLNMADYLAAKGHAVESGDWAGHCRLITHILDGGLDQEGAPRAAPKLLDGHALMEALGLPPGPQVGRLLEAVAEAQGAGEVTTPEEALELARRLVEAG